MDNATIQRPQYVVMSVPPLEDMPSRKILFLLMPVVEMLRERVEGRLPGGFIFKLLIVMIVFTCSLRDAVNLVNTDVVVRLFVGERVGKTTLFDFLERFARERKGLLREIARDLEGRCRTMYLPSSALYEGSGWWTRSCWTSLPGRLETMMEYRLDAVHLGVAERLKAFVKARLRRTRRRFQGRWTKKRSRSYFGLKVFPLISPSSSTLRLSSPTSPTRGAVQEGA
ncbi:hypothetical protein [Metallosphaera javensis (ex Sakai et al. 2022)]|uniref:hypothetical protein n=1 Tax=Metallosphaera javensis (ex Sakai et al. 2022) TaxID=2775498 RepID=UPI00258356BE|nr:MAG: hypothetical protein MjAS7_1914 [Metallosphaera javensis (ex Sakai et al. 2022)]